MTLASFTKDYVERLKSELDGLNLKALSKAAALLLKAHRNKKTIFIIGNGGSASTATHMAADLAKTVRGHQANFPWKGFRTVSLTDNTSLLTAWANDTGFENSFAGPLENLAFPGDLLIAISSSGNSLNILKAVKLARKLKLKTIGISGFGGGKLKNLVDVAIISKEKSYGPVEDLQLITNHLLTNYFISFFKGSRE